jgi:hypothetical protein
MAARDDLIKRRQEHHAARPSAAAAPGEDHRRVRAAPGPGHDGSDVLHGVAGGVPSELPFFGVGVGAGAGVSADIAAAVAIG